MNFSTKHLTLLKIGYILKAFSERETPPEAKASGMVPAFRRGKNEPPAGRLVTEARHREENFSHTATSPFQNGLEVMTYVACHFW